MAVSTGYNTQDMEKGAYVSFGGSDIIAVVGNKMLGTLQAISWSVQREKGPIYTMRQSADPLAFARGKRAIAGSLVFITIDRQAFLNDIPAESRKFWANTTDWRATDPGEGAVTLDQLFEDGVNDVDYSPYDADNSTFSRKNVEAWYGDQILPFDVNMIAANEYGQSMKKVIVGLEILNEGGGVSVDDLVMEEQYTYIARSMTQWLRLTRAGGTPVVTST